MVETLTFDSNMSVCYYWDQPDCPQILPHQWYKAGRSSVSRGIYYMRHVPLDNDLSGLTVSWFGMTNMSFHMHREQSSSSIPSTVEVDQCYGNDLLWIHFPLSLGERICGLWVSTWPGGIAAVSVRESKYWPLFCLMWV